MKRSSFDRPRYVTPPPAPPRPLAARAVPARIDPAVPQLPRPKHPVVVSEAYRALVRQLPCARCGHVGATQFCHADCGKGAAYKTDDRRGWAGCGPHDGTAGCHYLVGSSGHYPKERRRLLEAIYARWTREQILQAGLWPPAVPHWDEKGE